MAERHYRECDECQKQVPIQADERRGALPEGWWEIHKRLEKTWWTIEVCSWQCAMAHVERNGANDG